MHGTMERNRGGSLLVIGRKPESIFVRIMHMNYMRSAKNFIVGSNWVIPFCF